MFTGIVEELGTVTAVERSATGAMLVVACSTVVADARVGDSINVNGCCVTITRLGSPSGFACDLMGETLARTALGALTPGAPVNLERALRADSRLGGHLVQGHVDGVGHIVAVQPHEQWTVMAVSLPAALAPYVVEKGSVTVDGTSLTVTAVDEGAFSVGLIPHTLAVTALGQRRVGDAVNLEVDIIAKYVERLLRGGGATVYRHKE
ncbi:MAG: riboflavin synthase [Actinomycetota bacterium]|jgi:riboflavin synthase|nr:riboflavin synthase [Euzebyaceae bacterium]MDQ3451866.1 riboflavin synthase [Actinomycetota bacterium]